jgi:hypothetical protein
MEVIAAHAGGCSERAEARHCIGVFDEATGLLHGHSMLLGERRFRRSTPLARPESSMLGLVARRMETDMLSSRPPRRTGRPAIDTRRLHGIVEETISVPIAADHSRPTLRIVYKRR